MQNIIFGANNLSPVNIISNLIVAFVLSLVLAIVYKNTHKGFSYSQSFLFTLVLSGIVISAVMMVIGNSLAIAFGAFGAFSVIRFRAAIKDTKDMAYIFLVLVVGMAVGTNNYLIAFAVSILAIIIILILTKMNFGSIRKYDFILSFTLDTTQSTSEAYKETFDKFLKSKNLLHINAKEGGKVLKLSFNVRFIDDKENDKFLVELGSINGVSNVGILSAKNDIEY